MFNCNILHLNLALKSRLQAELKVDYRSLNRKLKVDSRCARSASVSRYIKGTMTSVVLFHTMLACDML